MVGDDIPHTIENGGNKVEGKKEEEWVRELPASILVAELVQKVTAGKIFGVCPGDKPRELSKISVSLSRRYRDRQSL